jgi:hypothetical protein
MDLWLLNYQSKRNLLWFLKKLFDLFINNKVNFYYFRKNKFLFLNLIIKDLIFIKFFCFCANIPNNGEHKQTFNLINQNIIKRSISRFSFHMEMSR